MAVKSDAQRKEESDSATKNSLGIFDFHVDVLETLNEFRLREEFCDIRLKVGDRTFACHRCVLASTSGYFYALLGPHFKECDQDVIEVPNIDPIIFDHILNFMYGKLLKVGDDIVHLLFAISYLQLKRGEKIYEDIIKNRIRLKEAVEIFAWPDLKFTPDLYKYVRKFICANFYKFQELNQVLQLSFETIKEMLVSADLLVFNETDILNFITKWICYDFKNRLQYTEQIIKCVCSRVSLPNCLLDTMSGVKSTEQKEIYLKIFLGGLLSSGNNSSATVATISIDSHPLMFFYKPEEVVQLLESKNAKKLPVSLKWFDDVEGAVLNQNVFISCSVPHTSEELPYISAGFSFYGCETEGYEWTPLHPTESISKDLVVCNSTLYSYHHSWTDYNFYFYERHLDRWFAVPPMITPRENAGITADGCCLYAVGGQSSAAHQRLSTIEMYDVRCKSWMDVGRLTDDMKALKINQYRKKVIIVDGKLYVVVDRSRGLHESNRSFYLNAFDLRNYGCWNVHEDAFWDEYEENGHQLQQNSQLVPLKPEFVFTHRRNDVKVVKEDWNVYSYYTFNNTWSTGPMPKDWYYDSETVSPIKPISKPLC